MALFDVFKKKTAPENKEAPAQNDRQAEQLLAEAQQLRDPGKAFPLYEQAAKLGNAEAAYWVGMMYIAGTGVQGDAYKGLTFLYEAASKNHAQAWKLYLDYLWALYNEAVKTKNYGPVIPYIQKAAELGDAEAQAKLSALYWQGAGNLKEDRQAALYWAQKSAAQGNRNGIDLVNVMKG